MLNGEWSVVLFDGAKMGALSGSGGNTILGKTYWKTSILGIFYFFASKKLTFAAQLRFNIQHSPFNILGIRHHGVGSAQRVLAMLERLKPDCILLEGPPEMEAMMQLAGHPDLVPPVALLCYDEAEPSRAAFYPFAAFSPEWQAACYAKRCGIPLRMMDLSLSATWELQQAAALLSEDNSDEKDPMEKGDPIAYFARLAGYSDADLWWEHQFEQRNAENDPEGHFEAVMLMMQTLRESGVRSSLDQENVFREAQMAEKIRQAQRELYQNIAVVCGAWHAPTLLRVDTSQASDAKILKALPKSKIKVRSVWVGWTNERLSFQSGYGAGLHSPGWYEHLWEHPTNPSPQWLSKVARLLREKKMDISTAHVIEALRLAESLAALRQRPWPGLLELNEATQTVMCMGDAVLLDLVRRELVVGHRIGTVPDDLPKVPLQADFEAAQKSLRLPSEKEQLEVDLRDPLGPARSAFLHRLSLLEVQWGNLLQQSDNRLGGFKEYWQLHWSPEVTIQLIDKAPWGNTVAVAAQRFVAYRTEHSVAIPELAQILQRCIPADLPETVGHLLERIHDLAALGAEIAALMAAIPPLVSVARYGDARNTDRNLVQALVEDLAVRICLGLPNACYGLDEQGAYTMFGHLKRFNESVGLLDIPSLSERWANTLGHLAGKADLHPLLSGCVCRLLLDARLFEANEVAQRFGFALSKGQVPSWSAAWLEGFLKGSGLILLYDDTLWNLLYAWVALLPHEDFIALLPILRRTFSKFEPGERRRLGEKARSGLSIAAPADVGRREDFDEIVAEKALGLTKVMLGV